MIMSYLGDDHRDWDLNIHAFQFAYNTAVHESLGVSPAYLNLGRDPCPIRNHRTTDDNNIVVDDHADRSGWIQRMDRMVELRDIVNQRIRRSSERYAAYYNDKRRNILFEVGDQVYKPTHVLSKKSEQVVGKLAPRYAGPFVISKVVTPVIVEMETPEGKYIGRSHVKFLKLVKRAENVRQRQADAIAWINALSITTT
ncbi:uncharacterized protein LOC106694033 [Microplitis demolitor]|uniref:uncharacterized protein LOC106694033 n=1 Tax=Microplitis demolitor TaxID=69319 RepID=UPI0006D4CD04|nr:uncharacterized protein LOC106694033 [Microplitis demolitor]